MLSICKSAALPAMSPTVANTELPTASQHHDTPNDEELSKDIGEHDEEVASPNGIFLETDKKQNGVRRKEQHGAGKCHGGGGARIGQQLIKSEAVHGAVDQQIKEHRKKQRFRQMLSQGSEYKPNRDEIYRRRNYQSPNGDRLKGYMGVIGKNKENMRQHKTDSAGGKPLDPARNQQHIPEPTREQRRNDDPPHG